MTLSQANRSPRIPVNYTAKVSGSRSIPQSGRLRLEAQSDSGDSRELRSQSHDAPRPKKLEENPEIGSEQVNPDRREHPRDDENTEEDSHTKKDLCPGADSSIHGTDLPVLQSEEEKGDSLRVNALNARDVKRSLYQVHDHERLHDLSHSEPQLSEVVSSDREPIIEDARDEGDCEDRVRPWSPRRIDPNLSGIGYRE